MSLPGKLYSYEQLSTATGGFAPANKLKDGSFAEVYFGTLDGVPAAIKRLHGNGDFKRAVREFEREVQVLGALHHPHLLPLLGSCPSHSLLVYELMTGGSLEDRLSTKSDRPPLDWQDRVRICCEVAMALQHLHTCNPPIVHKDVKPSNVLLDDRLRAKLADVGLASLMEPGSSGAMTMVQATLALSGTPQYMDPEYVRTGTYSTKSDIYALGITMMQVLTARTDIHLLADIEDAVREAYATGTGACSHALQILVDIAAGPWPMDHALRFARLALRCCEMRRASRPALDSAVLPELLELSALAADATPASAPPLPGGGFGSDACGEVVEGPWSARPQLEEVFIDPITHMVMEDPVVAFDGHTYERSAIQQWLANHDTSPMTNTRLESKLLLPNHTVRAAIAEWRERQGQQQPQQLSTPPPTRNGIQHAPPQQQQGPEHAQSDHQRRDQTEDYHRSKGTAEEANGGRRLIVRKDLIAAGVARWPRKYECSELAAAGDLDGLRQARKEKVTGRLPWGSETCASAAEEGHLEVLQWLHSHGCTWDARTCAAAARGGHLQVLQWARSRGCPWDERTCSMAAAGGHLAVLKWARQTGCSLDAEACMWASRNGHQDVVMWMQSGTCSLPGATGQPQHQQQCQMQDARTNISQPVVSAAPVQDLITAGVVRHPRKYQCSVLASAGDLAGLKVARSRGLTWGSETCAAAAEGGHLEVLKWAKASGCSWDAKTCAAAARGGHMAVLQWARGNGCLWDERTCNMAAAGGHLEVLKWACQRGCRIDADWCRKWATKGHHSEVSLWLKDRRCFSYCLD